MLGELGRTIEQAARKLVSEGFLLEEDVERIVKSAVDWGRPLHDIRLPHEE